MHQLRGMLLYWQVYGSFVTDVLKNAPPSKPTVTSPIGWLEQTATDPVNAVLAKELKFNFESSVKIV